MEIFEQFQNNENISKKNMIILRGVPGSGKTTLAKVIANGDESIICCADDYFMKSGKYEWKVEELSNAHKACQDKCEELIKSNAPLIIIANTNVKESDFEFYIKAGEKAGYKIFTLIVENRHGHDNVHNVPDDKVEQMKRKFRIAL